MKPFLYLFVVIVILQCCQQSTRASQQPSTTITDTLVTLIQNDSTIRKSLESWDYKVGEIVIEDSVRDWRTLVFHFDSTDLYDSMGPKIAGLDDNNGYPLPYIFKDSLLSREFSTAEKSMLEQSARAFTPGQIKLWGINLFDWPTKQLRIFRTKPLFIKDFCFMNVQVNRFELEMEKASIAGEVWPILNLTYIFRKQKGTWELVKVHKFFYT